MQSGTAEILLYSSTAITAAGGSYNGTELWRRAADKKTHKHFLQLICITGNQKPQLVLRLSAAKAEHLIVAKVLDLWTGSLNFLLLLVLLLKRHFNLHLLV